MGWYNVVLDDKTLCPYLDILKKILIAIANFIYVIMIIACSPIIKSCIMTRFNDKPFENFAKNLSELAIKEYDCFGQNLEFQQPIKKSKNLN